MEKEHKRAIQRNFLKLTETCNINTLLPLLIEKGVFSDDMVKLDENDGEDKDKKRQLFLKILRRGPEAFDKLVASLRETNQHNLADCLDLRTSTEEQVLSHASARPFLIPDNGNIISSIQHAKKFDNSYFINLRSEPLRVVVRSAERFVSYSDHAHMPPMYSTQSKHRGVALIINIVEYLEDSHNFRNGAYVDDKNLKDLFTQMGLKVISLRNLNRSDFEKEIQEFTHNPHLNLVDIAVVVIMGHGSSDANDTIIYASDGQVVEASWIEEQLNNYNCPFLKMKPKIIIYQVCRGPLTDYGISHNVTRRTELDSASSKKQKSVRTYSDMLIAHSTLTGFQSHRDPYTGSWYIELICEFFMNHAHNTDVQDLLSMVDHKLSKIHSEKMTLQTSSYTNIGFKKCYFHPGIYLEEGVFKKFSNI